MLGRTIADMSVCRVCHPPASVPDRALQGEELAGLVAVDVCEPRHPRRGVAEHDHVAGGGVLAAEQLHARSVLRARHRHLSLAHVHTPLLRGYLPFMIYMIRSNKNYYSIKPGIKTKTQKINSESSPGELQ